MTTHIKWQDGTEADVEHPPSWIEWLIANATLYMHGFTAHPVPEKPYHMASIPPDQVKALALRELAALRAAGSGI